MNFPHSPLQKIASYVTELQRCQFHPDGRGFLAGSPTLDFTVSLDIDVPTFAAAKDSFKAVVGDPSSAVFWGRWDDTQTSFAFTNDSFVVSS